MPRQVLSPASNGIREEGRLWLLCTHTTNRDVGDRGPSPHLVWFPFQLPPPLRGTDCSGFGRRGALGETSLLRRYLYFSYYGCLVPTVCSPPFPTYLPFPLGLTYLFLGLVSGASSLSNNQPCEVRWVFPEITSQKIMQLKCKGKKKHSCCLILCFN